MKRLYKTAPFINPLRVGSVSQYSHHKLQLRASRISPSMRGRASQTEASSLLRKKKKAESYGRHRETQGRRGWNIISERKNNARRQGGGEGGGGPLRIADSQRGPLPCPS